MGLERCECISFYDATVQYLVYDGGYVNLHTVPRSGCRCLLVEGIMLSKISQTKINRVGLPYCGRWNLWI